MGHVDVAAYALGALGPDEDAAFRAHLDECASCADELVWMSQLSSLLSEVDTDEVLGDRDDAPDAGHPSRPGEEAELELAQRIGDRHGGLGDRNFGRHDDPLDLPANPDRQRVLDGVLNKVRGVHEVHELRGQRRRSHRRMMVAAVAAGVAVIATAAAIGTGLLDGGSRSGTEQRPQAGTHEETFSPNEWARALLVIGDVYSARDAASGVSARVGIEPKKWGTHVALELRHIKGPLRCRLVAVGQNGDRETVTGWNIPEAGYDVPGSPSAGKPLYVHGATPFTQDELTSFEIQKRDGEVLLTVPV